MDISLSLDVGLSVWCFKERRHYVVRCVSGFRCVENFYSSEDDAKRAFLERCNHIWRLFNLREVTGIGSRL